VSLLRAICLGSCLLLLAVGLAAAQTERDPRGGQTDPDPTGRLERPPEIRRPDLPMNQRSLLDMRRRLIELDRLLSLGSISRAETLLKDLEQHGALKRELVGIPACGGHWRNPSWRSISRTAPWSPLADSS